MKKIIFFLLTISTTISCFATDYYLRSTGGYSPQLATSWTTSTDGLLGTSPTALQFAAAGHNFYLRNALNNPNAVYLQNSWVVNSGSRLIVGYSGAGSLFSFVITGSGTPPTGILTATVDITESNSLFFSQTLPSYVNITLGNLSLNSAVVYNGLVIGVNQTLLLGNYGNIVVHPASLSSVTIPSGIITIANSFTIPVLNEPIVSTTSTFNYNGSINQTITGFGGGNTNKFYQNIILSGTGGIKTIGANVRVNGKLSVQCANTVQGSNILWKNNATTILEYKPADGVTLNTGPEWNVSIGAVGFLAGGVIIDALGTTGMVSLNQQKDISYAGTDALTPKLEITAVGKFFTNNHKLTLAGNFIRATGSQFTAGSSDMEFTGASNLVNVAGFKTTGLVSFTKTNPNSVVNITDNLPDDGSIGTFPMLINCGNNTSTNNTEVNFRNGTSCFKTSGQLTITQGGLYLHRTYVAHDINTTNGGNSQINQCGNFVLNGANSLLSFCSNVTPLGDDEAINIEGKSVLQISGNFTKTTIGKLQTNGKHSFNGEIHFIGVTNHTLTNDASGRLYQTTFRVKTGSTLTLASDIVMNGGYSTISPGNTPLVDNWEKFMVEDGGTLDFKTFRILGGRNFEAQAGATLITSHPEGFYDGANDGGLNNNTMGCIRTADPNSDQVLPTPTTFASLPNFKTRFFSNDASYIYTGSGNQSSGLFNTYAANPTSPTTPTVQLVRNLGFNKTAITDVVTAIQPFTVNGQFQQTNGIFAYTAPSPTATLTLNGNVTGSGTGFIRGCTTCDLVLRNTGISGNADLGTLYIDQTVPGVSVGTGLPNDLTAITQGTTNVFRQFNVSRTNGTNVELGNFMQIYNILTPKSGTIISKGKLVMLSNNATSSSILTFGSGADIIGDVVVQSNFTGNNDATLAYRGFRLISSPIVETAYSNVNSTNFFRQLYNRFIITCANWPFDGCDFKPVRAPNSQTLQSYLEDGTAGLSSFKHQTPESATDIGIGYFFFFRGNRDILNPFTAGKINAPFAVPETWVATYIGEINKGKIEVKVNNTINGEATLDGLNLLGNPYPATLDLQVFFNDNSSEIDDFISIMKPDRTGFITTSGGITNNRGYNTILGNTPTGLDGLNLRYIQPCQGFFVKRSKANSGTVTFTEDQKADKSEAINPLRLLSIKDDDLNLTPTKKLLKHAKRKLLRLTLYSNESYEQTTIVLEPGNNANYSGNDAPYQSNGPLGLNSLTADGKSTCINFMPEVSLVNEVKLNITSGTNNNLKLTFDDLTGLENYQMLLQDNLTKTLTKINSIKDTVIFTVNKDSVNTFGNNRFVLVFKTKNPLPPQETEFKAEMLNNNVWLTWVVLNQQNSKNIIVQRSTNGINFIDIKTINFKGKLNKTLFYSYLDRNAEAGTLYYRLQNNNTDGSCKFSPVRRVNFDFDNDKQVIVFPNPVKDQLNVHYKTFQLVNILVYDYCGKIVNSFKNVNSLNFNANVNNMASGMYILKLTQSKTNKVIAVTKFIKQ